MLNRVFLILICILSLGWITYVGLDIYYKTDRLDPELVFSENDEELLIINRTDEFPSVEVDFEIPEAINNLAHQFIQTPRNERIFISKTQSLLLIESPNYWTENSVILYLDRKGINYQKKDKKIYIDSYPVKYKYHYLLIAPESFKKENNPNFEFPKWDKNATAVILKNIHQKDEKITEIYQFQNGQIVYQTQYKKEQKGNKVDDFRLYAAYLPDKISDYHFYETNYALGQEIITEKNPISKWLDRGFVKFHYENVLVYMTDSKIGEDPFNTLNTLFGKDTLVFTENIAIKNIAITNDFPSATQKGFYISRVGDKTIFSENIDINKKIVADYELGHTLLLNPTQADKIFGQLPDKVSERQINQNDNYAISTHNRQSVKYFLQGLQPSSPKTNEIQSNEELTQTLVVPVEGKLVDAIGKGNQQYFVTSSNHFYSVNNGQIIWQAKIDGKLVGKIKIIDYEGSGKVYLLLNTEKAIYLFTEFGENLMNTIKTPINTYLNEVNFYRWKNISYLVYADTPHQIRLLSLQNGSNKAIKHAINGNLQKAEVFVQNGQVIGLIYNSEAAQTINLTNAKALKVRSGIPSNFIAMKNNGTLELVGYNNEKLAVLDYAGAQRNIDNFAELKQMKIINIENKNYIAFISYQVLHVYTHDFKKVASFNLPTNGIQDYDICLVNGELVAGFIDGLENKAFIINKDNKVISDEVEAKDYLFLSYSKNRLNLLTVGNVYAVQYYDILKKID